MSVGKWNSGSKGKPLRGEIMGLFNNDYDIQMDVNEYTKFLEMPKDKQFEYLTGIKLYLYQKLYIKFVFTWWNFMRKANPYLKAIDLWQSIYKSRY